MEIRSRDWKDHEIILLPCECWKSFVVSLIVESLSEMLFFVFYELLSNVNWTYHISVPIIYENIFPAIKRNNDENHDNEKYEGYVFSATWEMSSLLWFRPKPQALFFITQT